MPIKTALTILVALAVLGAPCRAQTTPAAVPVLASYTDQQWIYFAPLADEALIFAKYPYGDESNVWVKIERSSANRKVIAKTEAWTDRRGCPHTVSMLKFQLEFNSQLDAEVKSGANLPYFVSPVLETGILDRRTLGIPFAKLSVRVQKLSDRLSSENASADSIAAANPSGAALKKKYASYIAEKVSDATARLAELDSAFNAVPLSIADDIVPGPGPAVVQLNGLRGLEIPAAAPGYLRVSRDESRTVRFVETSATLNPELFTTQFVDLLGMTPAVVAELQAKEAAAVKAVSFAESLCRDMLTPPCP